MDPVKKFELWEWKGEGVNPTPVTLILVSEKPMVHSFRHLKSWQIGNHVAV